LRWASPSLAAAVATLLLVVAAGGWFNGRAPKLVEAAHLSIVVLPFANLSGDPAQDYLADSLTDELTTALARIHDSFVIARNTAFTYKGKPVDAKAIGKDLGVRYVLEGSVLPSGDQVRVNAQLIEADSGAHLWADQFDTPRANLLRMQDEIVTRLARAMDIQLPEAEATRFKRTQAANPDAEDLALQCHATVLKGGYLGEDADAGYRLCEQALSIDSNNVSALSTLSLKFFRPITVGRQGDLRRADELVSRALALDPNYAWAHSIKAGILLYQGRLDEAIVQNERALTLDPALLSAVNGLSWEHFYLGQFEKSLEFSDRAIRLSPRDPSLEWYRARSAANMGLKQYDRAIEWARRALAIKPNDNIWAHFNMIAALALSGHQAEAHEALQRYLASVPSGPKTIAAWKEAASPILVYNDPRYLDMWDRDYLRGPAQSRDAGGVSEGSLQERVRCWSLVDWPVYPRLSRIMRDSPRSCNLAAMTLRAGKPDFSNSPAAGGGRAAIGLR
jgi:TolB-like protein